MRFVGEVRGRICFGSGCLQIWKCGGKGRMTLEEYFVLVSDGFDGLTQFHLFGWQFTCYHGYGKISFPLSAHGLLYSYHLLAKTSKDESLVPSSLLLTIAASH